MNKRFAVPGVNAATPLVVAAPALLLAKAEPLFELEAAARGGADADAVHDMRVASRRLREALRLMAPLYPRRAYRRWYRRIRRVTRALGPVRDSDVFIEEFSRLAPELGDGGRRAIAFIVGFRMGQRVGELARLNAELAGVDLDRNRTGFAAFASALAPGVDGQQPLASFAHAAIAERAATVFGAQPAALDIDNVAAQHALRIDYKRLRYAVEALAPCYGDGFDDVHKTLTAFQDALGDLHDVHVFLDMLRDPERIAAAARAGVSAEDLHEVVAILKTRFDREFERFNSLARQHPAEVLLPRLLLPLATAQSAVLADAGASPTEEAEPPAGDVQPPSETADVEAPVLSPVTVGDEPWQEGWETTEARASRIVP